MARTSRTGATTANVDALDNLNLDDMFADEGDALFDGLDIDLGNMDDIATSASNTKKGEPGASVETSPQVPSVDDETRSRRRSAKRKTPMFFDDDDDDYVEKPKKKKRPPTKKKASAPLKSTTPELPLESTPPTKPKARKGRATSVTMPPPINRVTSAGQIVAAAGQFGGRQNKRSASFTNSKAAKARPPAQAPPQRSLSATIPSSMAQIYATHPGLMQSPFCGILPSNTHFYPFMPALPNEVNMKHRKIFPIIDRIHTAFTTQANSTTLDPNAGIVKESDPIFRLMEEAYRDEKGETPIDRNQAIGNAIASLRKTISVFEKNRLAGDLLAICALLKRQHEFLKQNSTNMEQWCKNHFSQADYDLVYLPPKVKAPEMTIPTEFLLSTLGTAEFKVRIVCSGLKDYNMATRSAVLPPKTPLESAKSKKRKAPVSSTATVTSTKSSAASVATSETLPKLPTPSYSELRPTRRRKNIADMISRTARDIEAKVMQRFDDRLQFADRQQNELQKFIDEDKIPVIHTAGMWRWLEKSGHTGRITDDERQWRLDGVVSRNSCRPRNLSIGDSADRWGGQWDSPRETSNFERLQSLLIVEELDEGDDGSDCDISMLYDEGDTVESTSIWDLLGLSLEERTFLQLRSCGFDRRASLSSDQVDSSQRKEEPDDELGLVIKGMIADLGEITAVNNRRASFLEEVVSSHRLDESESKQKTADATLVAKCQLLIKKAKEMKIKNGKPKGAKDEIILPW